MRSFLFRSFSLVALVFLSTLTPLATRAEVHGVYKVSYSGGTVMYGTGSSQQSAPYAALGSPPSPWGGSHDAFGSSPTVTCSGAITATFTWTPDPNNPNEPPPVSVIVSQTSAVTWRINTTIYGGHGSCDNGLGGTPTTAADGLSGSCSSSVYMVKSSPGPSFTLPSCTPTANGTGSSQCGNSAASASYSASASLVTIQLTGQNSANQALVGQQITAQVVTGIGTVVSNNWSVTGSAFKTYYEGLSRDQKVALSSDAGDFTGQKFYFYDVTGNDTVMVSDYPNIQLPDGTTVNVAAKSTNITFKKPSTLWRVKEGFIQQFTLPRYSGSLLYGLGTDPATAATYPDGEDWYPVDITMPSGFASAGTAGFTQLVTPNFTQTHNGSTTGGPKPQGLDNTFAFGQWTLPGQGNSGDSPNFVTNASANSAFVSGDQQAFSEQFTTYVMYRPPAVGSQGTIWAPLQSYNWSARTTIIYNGSQWSIVQTQSAPTTSSALAVKGSDTNDPPQWSVIYTNGR